MRPPPNAALRDAGARAPRRDGGRAAPRRRRGAARPPGRAAGGRRGPHHPVLRLVSQRDRHRAVHRALPRARRHRGAAAHHRPTPYGGVRGDRPGPTSCPVATTSPSPPRAGAGRSRHDRRGHRARLGVRSRGWPHGLRRRLLRRFPATPAPRRPARSASASRRSSSSTCRARSTICASTLLVTEERVSKQAAGRRRPVYCASLRARSDPKESRMNNADRRIRVGVLLGGASAEREISLASGRMIADYLPSDRYEVLLFDSLALMAGNPALPVDLAEKARALVAHAGGPEELAGRDRELPTAFQHEIQSAAAEAAPATEARRVVDSDSVSTSPSSACTAPTAKTARCRACSRSWAFPTSARASLPRLWRWTRPWPGRCSPPPGIPVARAVVIEREERDPEATRRAAVSSPAFVKPSRQGSSVGMSIVAAPRRAPAGAREGLRVRQPRAGRGAARRSRDHGGRHG